MQTKKTLYDAAQKLFMQSNEDLKKQDIPGLKQFARKDEDETFVNGSVDMRDSDHVQN